MIKYIIFLFFMFASAREPFEINYIDIQSNGMLSIVGDNIPVIDMLKQLAKIRQQNFVFTKLSNHKVSVLLRNITAEQALQHVLLAASLQAQEIDGAVYIGSVADIAKIVLSKQQQYIEHTFKLKYILVKDMRTFLIQEKLIQAVNISMVDMDSNTITLQVSPTVLAQVKQLVQLKDVPQRQVRIKAYIVSVDQDYLQELGMQASYSENTIPDKKPSGIVSNLLQRIFLAKGGLLDARLRAIESSGHGVILSSPELIAMDSYSAFIETGAEIPYTEATSSSSSNIVFKKAVLSLQVTPRIVAGGKISMHIAISQDQPGASYEGALAIKTRKITTDALVASKDTLALGGILEQQQTDAVSGVPLLEDLPILGYFFSLKDVKMLKKQLIIFITPEIIS